MGKCVLRKVTVEDCERLFKWVNEKKARENSFHTEKISWQEHVLWFQNKLEDASSHMYVLLCDGIEAGQIRVDVEENIGHISYSIALEYRGQGLGKKILSLVEEECSFLEELQGKVKTGNQASCHCFESNDYQGEEIKGGIIYKKELKGRP